MLCRDDQNLIRQGEKLNLFGFLYQPVSSPQYASMYVELAYSHTNPPAPTAHLEKNNNRAVIVMPSKVIYQSKRPQS